MQHCGIVADIKSAHACECGYAPGEKHEMCEFDALIDKMVVDRDGESGSQSKKVHSSQLK